MSLRSRRAVPPGDPEDNGASGRAAGGRTMPGSHAMEAPATPRGASLVSVDGRTYPLQSVRMDAEASGGIAQSTLVQTYRNPYAEPLEVIYTLPLPADGAVVGYAMRLGERVIR